MGLAMQAECVMLVGALTSTAQCLGASRLLGLSCSTLGMLFFDGGGAVDPGSARHGPAEVDVAGGKLGCDPSVGGCSFDSGVSGGSIIAIEDVQGGLPRPPEVVDVGTSFPCDTPVGVETHLSPIMALSLRNSAGSSRRLVRTWLTSLVSVRVCGKRFRGMRL